MKASEMARIRRRRTRRQVVGRRPLRVLISAGPTREPVDPVRFLSNYSTGYMGARLAAEAMARGHRVVVVRGPCTEPMPPGVKVIPVERSDEMDQALRQHARWADVIIMAAAVADFRPVRTVAAKLSRQPGQVLHLAPTPDILVGLPRRTGQVIVGFAVESDDVVTRAQQKLRAKNLDLLLAQRTNGHGAPFGRRPVEAWFLTRGEPPVRWGKRSKSQVARALLDKIEALWYGQRRPNREHEGYH